MTASRFSFSLPLFSYTLFSQCVLLFLSIGYLHAQPTPDFRKVRWSFSRPQVKDAEMPNTSSRKGDKLVYKRVALKDRTVGLEYDFLDDLLLSATYYYYTTTGITEAEVRAAAADFEASLQEKYGKGKTGMVGTIRERVWLTPRTRISLLVGQMDKGWSVEIVYLCRVCSGDPGTGVVVPREVTPNVTNKELADF
jgi:hypothetical protein